MLIAFRNFKSFVFHKPQIVPTSSSSVPAAVMPLRFRTGRGRLGQPGVRIVIVDLVLNRRNRGFRCGHFDFGASEGVNAVSQVPLPPLPALGEEGLRNCGSGLKRVGLEMNLCQVQNSVSANLLGRG